jgi:hypothetical protein
MDLSSPEQTGTASSTQASACCGVNACCTPGENPVDPTTTVAQAKTAAGGGLPILTSPAARTPWGNKRKLDEKADISETPYTPADLQFCGS